MKTLTGRNLALALIGLLALTIYILACTSFSPDDTKVLYPAFDSASGAVGVAAYDREARRSEMLLVPVAWDGTTNVPAPQFLRAQWLPDGRHILAAWAGGKDNDESLTLALIPWGARAPVRTFHLPPLKDAAMAFTVPLCLAGQQVFFMAAPHEAVRLDLKTGVLAHHEFGDVKHDLFLYPAADGAGVFYVEEREAPEGGTVFGRLDPRDFSRKPLLVITNEMADQSIFAYDADGKTVAFVEKAGDRLVVLRQGGPSFRRPLGNEGGELRFGNGLFSAKGDVLWATFQRKAKETNTVSYGLMEIPLSNAAVREMVLIPAAQPGDDTAALYFQAAISHDGKTAAVASTYLAFTDKGIKADDCALFLVDLASPKRSVTKVPIPLPAH